MELALVQQVDHAGRAERVLVPAGGLQPVLTVSDPGSHALATATAAVAGRQVVIQTLPVSTAGLYTLVVAAGAGTSGSYSLQSWLQQIVHGLRTRGQRSQ